MKYLWNFDINITQNIKNMYINYPPWLEGNFEIYLLQVVKVKGNKFWYRSVRDKT